MEWSKGVVNAPILCPSLQPAGRMRMGLVLFQRDDCHLCDLALEVLAAAHAPDFESVFIDDVPSLEQRYGLRVPVLSDDAGRQELDWPFDVERVRGFLGSESQVSRRG